MSRYTLWLFKQSYPKTDEVKRRVGGHQGLVLFGNNYKTVNKIIKNHKIINNYKLRKDNTKSSTTTCFNILIYYFQLEAHPKEKASVVSHEHPEQQGWKKHVRNTNIEGKGGS